MDLPKEEFWILLLNRNLELIKPIQISSGGFSGTTNISVGTNPRSVAIGDFNGDGILDILTSDFGDDTASVLLGNGDGTFQARNSLQLGTYPSQLQQGISMGMGY